MGSLGPGDWARETCGLGTQYSGLGRGTWGLCGWGLVAVGWGGSPGSDGRSLFRIRSDGQGRHRLLAGYSTRTGTACDRLRCAAHSSTSVTRPARRRWRHCRTGIRLDADGGARGRRCAVGPQGGDDGGGQLRGVPHDEDRLADDGLGADTEFIEDVLEVRLIRSVCSLGCEAGAATRGPTAPTWLPASTRPPRAGVHPGRGTYPFRSPPRRRIRRGGSVPRSHRPRRRAPGGRGCGPRCRGHPASR